MTRGIWGDPERYLETYWSMYEGVWRHGDWALIDEDGDWFLLGRSDDTINVAGKRLGPAEVESVLVSHPAVAESAVVGVPRRDQGRGDLVLLRAHRRRSATASPRSCASSSRRSSGRPFKPSRIVFVDALPKTRSAKILRRAVRAVAIGEDPGDMSSAENPQALDGIRRARSRSLSEAPPSMPRAPASRRSPPPRRRPRGRRSRPCRMGGGSSGCARSRARRA